MQGTAATNLNIRHISNAISPVSNHEMIVVNNANSNGGNIVALQQQGGQWSKVFGATGLDATQAKYRGFDVAYSNLSGDALVVYGGDTNNPKYRVIDASSGNTWSTEASVLGSGVGNEVAWVELVSKPSSDEIALVWADMSKDLRAIFWDGSSWGGSAQTLQTNMNTIDWKCFDAAYEFSDGHLLVAWARNSNDGFFHAKYTGSWSSVSSYTFSGDDEPNALELCAAPSGNGIIAATESDGSDTEFAFWNGTGWEDGTERDSSTVSPAAGEHIPGVAWIDANTAVGVWEDSTSSADDEAIDWATYSISSSSWTTKADVLFSNMNEFHSVRMANMMDGRLFMAAMTKDNELWFFTYDGLAWTRHQTANGTPDRLHVNTFPFSISVKNGNE